MEAHMRNLQMPVEEYTTPCPTTAHEDIPVEKLAALMKDQGIRHIPIKNESGIVGIVSDRDLRVAIALIEKDQRKVSAKEVMTYNPVFVNSNDPLDEVAFKMSESKIGSVLVMDDNDEFLGIFTVTDALNALIELARMNEN